MKRLVLLAGFVLLLASCAPAVQRADCLAVGEDCRGDASSCCSETCDPGTGLCVAPSAP